MKWNDAFPEVPEMFHAKIIEALNSQTKNATERTYYMRNKKLITVLAAVLAMVVFAMGAFAIISSLRVKDLEYKVSSGDATVIPENSAAPWLVCDGNDFVILSGYKGSPEYEGLAEWLNFIAGYKCDLDDIDYRSKNDPDFIGKKYPNFTVYDEFMEAKLLDIAGKYGLALSDNGSYHQDGEMNVSDAGDVAYTLLYSKKGTLIEGNVLNVFDISTYEEWGFETQNGTAVTLALGPRKALVFADTEDAFIAINVMTGTDSDWLDGDVRVSKESLEDFANRIDFSALKEWGTPTPAEDASDSIKAADIIGYWVCYTTDGVFADGFYFSPGGKARRYSADGKTSDYDFEVHADGENTIVLNPLGTPIYFPIKSLSQNELVLLRDGFDSTYKKVEFISVADGIVSIR